MNMKDYKRAEQFGEKLGYKDGFTAALMQVAAKSAEVNLDIKQHASLLELLKTVQDEHFKGL